MGAGDIVGVHPDIVWPCEVKSELVVLEIVLAHINIIAVTAYIVQRLTDRRAGTSFFTAGFIKSGAVPAACSVPADQAAVLEFLADLRQIPLICGKIQGSPDALEVVDLGSNLFGQCGEGLISSLELSIPVKIFPGVLCGAERGIKRDPDLLARIVVIQLTGFRARGYAIGVSIEQLAVDAVLVALFCVLYLLALQVVFVHIALEDRLDDVPQVRRFLADPCVFILLGIKGLKKL